jgi:MFS family permease
MQSTAKMGPTVPGDAQDPAQERPYRWYILAILTLVATLNGIDKHLMPAMAEPIKHEFHLSDTQFGFIAGFIYSLGFAVGGIPLTLLVDRVGRSRLLALLLAIWSGATALGSVVASSLQLTITRFLVGAAEVGGQPISMALIGDWFRIDRRGTAMGIWSISRSISLMVSFSLGGLIAVHWGWRYAFLLAGIPGICQRRRKSRPLGGAKPGHLIRVLASAGRA